MFDGRRLLSALCVGIVVQVVLLAFGLHASLVFAGVTEDLKVYWILNGVYCVIALSASLAAFRWARPLWRLSAAGVVLLAAVLVGWLSAP